MARVTARARSGLSGVSATVVQLRCVVECFSFGVEVGKTRRGRDQVVRTRCPRCGGHVRTPDGALEQLRSVVWSGYSVVGSSGGSMTLGVGSGTDSSR